MLQERSGLPAGAVREYSGQGSLGCTGAMGRASHEMSHWAEYDYIVINHEIDAAFAEVQSILKAERLKRERRTGLTTFVRRLQQQLEK